MAYLVEYCDIIICCPDCSGGLLAQWVSLSSGDVTHLNLSSSTTIMYIAGLNVAMSLTQGVEGLVAFTTLAQLISTSRFATSEMKRAEADAGTVSPLPTQLAKVITPVHGVALLSTPIVFILGVGLNRLEQPHWMLRFRFPSLWEERLGFWGTTAVRAVGCIASLACYRLFTTAVTYLGPRFHYIGVSSTPRSCSNCPSLLIVLSRRSARKLKS